MARRLAFLGSRTLDLRTSIMRLKRLILLTIAATLGCNAEPPQERPLPEESPLPEWRVEMRSIGNRVQEALSKDEGMELIFLVPDEFYGPPKKEPDTEYFNWWKVVGRVQLNDQQQQEVAKLLSTDIETNWMKGPAGCFEPRHALRVTTSDGPFDIALCFHCHELWCFDADGNRMKSQVGISESLQPVLNQLKPTDGKSKSTR